jgi:CheY-like chemotaxis protein
VQNYSRPPPSQECEQPKAEDIDGIGVQTARIHDREISKNAPGSFTSAKKVGTGTSISILVVDDDAMHRDLVVRIVVGAGFKAHTAEDGEEGWQALRKSKYDLLITDHEMPRLKGLELIGRLREVSEGPPCILMSGSLPEPEWLIKEMVYPGAFLSKPFAISELVATICSLLGSGPSADFR